MTTIKYYLMLTAIMCQQPNTICLWFSNYLLGSLTAYQGGEWRKNNLPTNTDLLLQLKL